MERDEILEQLFVLKRMRELECNRTDLSLLYNELADWAGKGLLWPVKVFVVSKQARALLVKQEGYTRRIARLSGYCLKLQEQLPAMMLLDLRYIDGAIDDLILGRTGSVKGLITLFEMRQEMTESHEQMRLKVVCRV